MQKNRNVEILYLAVTADRYELPLVVCDTLKELADWAGYSVSFLSEKIRNNQTDYANNCKFLKLSIKPLCIMHKNAKKVCNLIT